ncbi:MAG: ABC transporter ATP-binding protein [Acidobacteria bacterium]|nr:ABC transporter ATP-binding protein [Acidobacteriota bacterium]
MLPAIRAVDCSKSYRLYERPADRLFELITGRTRHRRYDALSSVDLVVEQGETLGIIGQNGAGKSTLLKLVCGVTTPTSGTLSTRGTIASILELGTGFHPDFSGRENASLNAAIIGLTPAEIRERLPRILEFSELGSFLDQPVKTYSSGMYMRLAFSVAVNVDPDVLVIDEALAVGDGHFQKKCVDKIREFQDRGKTILFCSHALYFVSTLCRRTLWLEGGKVRRLGKTIDVVHEYEEFLLEQNRTTPEDSAEKTPAVSPVRIRSVELGPPSGGETTVFSTGDDLVVRVVIESDDASTPIHILAAFDRSADEIQCFAVGTHFDEMAPLSGRNLYTIELRIDSLPLVRGDYDVVVFAGDEHGVHIYDRVDLRPAFSVGGDRYEIGLIRPVHQWSTGTALRKTAT